MQAFSQPSLDNKIYGLVLLIKGVRIIDTLTEARWLEIQFYYICIDVLNLRNDMMDVMDFIDNLRLFGDYDVETLKQTAQIIITSQHHKPRREEFCVMAQIFEVPIRTIKRVTNMHNKTYYALKHTEGQNPRMFYPRCTAEQREGIANFLTCFEKLKKVGLS